MTGLFWFLGGWFCGGGAMWLYFASMKLIRSREEWMAANAR